MGLSRGVGGRRCGSGGDRLNDAEVQVVSIKSLRAAAVVVLVWVVLAPAAPALATAGAQALRVMSFNIRFATPKDGTNAWPLRKELLFQTIETFNPHLLGLQEVHPSQGVEVRERFDGTYGFIGVPRDDGKTSGEMAAVMYRRDRFELVRTATFWLSDTPEIVGSKGWDAALPRVVTWVELRDRAATPARPIFFFNTHFDHKGRQAQLESAKLLQQRIVEIAGAAPVVVTGDFNAPQGSEPHRALLQVLSDTFPEIHPQPTTRHFTYHGFTGKNERANRIDWVLRSRHFKTLDAAIDRTNTDGRYPSDHFPVTAVLQWSDQPATTSATGPATQPAR